MGAIECSITTPQGLTLRDLRRIVGAKYKDCARRVVAESERLDRDGWMGYVAIPVQSEHASGVKANSIPG